MGRDARVHESVRERFDVGRCLGTGTFGAVFEARELARDSLVALKKLSLDDAAAIYGFKQEFRALADVTHPNLVGLHELFSVDDQLYLSMELVEGVGFLAWVRARDGDASATVADLPTMASLEPGSMPDSVPVSRTSGARRGELDVERLRDALRQLAVGVFAIHKAHKLHRDLKPSNVLVTAEGRVVILDFGLVAGVSAPGSRRERRVVGTPAYMSPEQAQGQPLGPASDWYAFGVMLFEALTGALPIEGEMDELLICKQSLDGPDPRTLDPRLPDDLADLCLGLLRRDPRARPTGSAVLRALGADAGEEADVDVSPLVGREHHLAALEDAFATARAGRAVTVLIHGPSGAGKSALLRRFLDGVVETHGATVAMGRCFERESVPFKALDALVDQLAEHLERMPRPAVAAGLPADVAALARLFPVLSRVPAIAAAPKRAEALDLPEIRRRASAALRELVRFVAALEPLVLCIDDLQWGDADSAALLLDLVAPPDPPPILLLAGYRSEDAEGIELVGALHAKMARSEGVGDVREIVVGPLAPREARALVRELFAARPRPPAEAAPDEADEVAAIARESGGSPLFLHELVRHVRSSQAGPNPTSQISLHDVLSRRIDRLPEPARRLLEAIAVAGHPVPAGVARRAAAIDDDLGSLAVLRGERLVRVHGRGAARELSTFHDRIRDAAEAGVADAERARIHLALAGAIEAAPDPDPEMLMAHFASGGDAERARRYAERAADRAAEALAFDRAAGLYRRSLAGAEEPQPLLVKLAHALAHAGRGAEAGRAYLDATLGAPPGEVLDLRRRAAEQFLRGGQIDEGLSAVRLVLAEVDLSWPQTPASALASLLYNRARLSLRGLGFEERAGTATIEELTRIDVCWSVGNGLNGVDIVRGADFQARHLLHALRAGDPARISRALASEAIFAAMEGGAGPRRAAELVERATALAERTGAPHAIAWAAGARAGTTFYAQRFREAVPLAERALGLLRGTCSDITWEVGSILGWWLLPGFYLTGDIPELARRLPAALKEAEDLGALYNATCLRTYMLPRALLAQDRPGAARRDSAEAIARWSRHGWHAQHYTDLLTRVTCSLYEGDPARAHHALIESWPRLKSSLLLRVEMPRAEAIYLRGASALAAAGPPANQEKMLRLAERDARELDGESSAFGRAFAQSLHAGVALARGKPASAADLYRKATATFEGLGMDLYAAAARWRRGEALRGEEGRALIDGADAWMQARAIARPDRFAQGIVPILE